MVHIQEREALRQIISFIAVGNQLKIEPEVKCETIIAGKDGMNRGGRKVAEEFLPSSKENRKSTCRDQF